MDSKHSDRVMAFDALFTTNHIQMLKLLLSYMEPSVQGRLAVYIKFLELQHTLQLVQNHPSVSIPPDSGLTHPEGGLAELLEEMMPFCSPAEQEKLQNIRNLYRNWENMQEMMQMFEMLQEISPELFSGGGMSGSTENNGESGGAPDFLNMLSGLGGADMSQMMETLQTMQGIFNTNNE